MATGVIAIQLLNRKHERNIDVHVLEQETEPHSTFLFFVWVFICVAFSLYSNTKRFQRLIYKQKWHVEKVHDFIASTIEEN